MEPTGIQGRKREMKKKFIVLCASLWALAALSPAFAAENCLKYTGQAFQDCCKRNGGGCGVSR
ncbi:hypothetical protein D3870_00820 [Noviherbaspirillum cavernae]|uniref:Uncharacterized protein n=1 Tax=Noviherbaspirillum cavernae TaxID=2320862 RepID=A0A418WXE0_9BURK|nr:hypothetical protein D3870_00820 [Noviherbaspirillum cavernae]